MPDSATANPIYRIPNWNAKYEKNRTRELKRAFWWACPNDFDDDDYLDIVTRENGEAILLAWRSIQTVASTCRPRGTLLRSGVRPYNAASLSAKTHVSQTTFEQALPVLVEMGLLVIDDAVPGTCDIPHSDAGLPQPGALDLAPKRPNKTIQYKTTSSSATRDYSREKLGPGDKGKTDDDGEGAGKTQKAPDSNCREMLGRHGLGTAAYLLEEFPEATADLIQLAMEGVSSRAKVGARVAHFRRRMPEVMADERLRAERRRIAAAKGAADKADKAAEAERQTARRAEVDATLAKLTDDQLERWKARVLKPLSRFRYDRLKDKDPRTHAYLGEMIVQAMEADRTRGAAEGAANAEGE